MSDKTQNDMRLTIDGKFNVPLGIIVWSASNTPYFFYFNTF